MSFQVLFPEPEPDITVETGLMRRTLQRTMAVHQGSALVVWTGPSRNGKTRTAQWMVRKMDEAYERSPHGFRAVHYEVGEISSWFGGEMKRGVRSLYHATIGRLPESTYRQVPIEDLAAQLVHGLRRKNIQMVMVDEAGLLSLDAIRGMVLVRNVAERLGWRLTLVFIGMDDLPTKMKKVPHINRRIHEWCYFQPYSFDETLGLLAALHPHFATLNLANPAHHAQVAFLHEQFHGLPGLLVPFLRRLAQRERDLAEYGLAIDVDMLRAVHLMTQRDEERAIADCENGYADASELSAGTADTMPGELADGPTNGSGAPPEKRRRGRPRKPRASDALPEMTEDDLTAEPDDEDVDGGEDLGDRDGRAAA